MKRRFDYHFLQIETWISRFLFQSPKSNVLLIFSSSSLFIFNFFLVYLLFCNAACLSVLIKDLLYLLSILCMQYVFSYMYTFSDKEYQLDQ
jgi:hypothetical protein